MGGIRWDCPLFLSRVRKKTPAASPTTKMAETPTFWPLFLDQKRGFRSSIVMLGRRSCCGFLKTRKGFSAAGSRSHDFFGFFPFFPIFCDFFRFFLKEIKRIFEIIEVPGRGSPGTSREPPGEPRAYPGDEVPGSFQSKRKEQINFFLLF